MNRVKTAIRGSVALGLSGGVDSAVSAYLLKKQGLDVTCVYIVCWDEGPECRARADRADAVKVAMELDLPIKVLDFQKEYKERVIDRFYDDYKRGLTPNPDIWCNSEIKFGMFYDWAMKEGFDFVATGHYARVTRSVDTVRTTDGLFSPAENSHLLTQPAGSARGGDQAQQASVGSSEVPADRDSYYLCVPKDTHKDQTYFLHTMKREQLARILFPLSEMMKSEVRELAKKLKLSVAEKKDSVGICFVGDVDARQFLKRRFKEEIGEVVDVAGKVIGHHKGIWFYTIGQRGGFEFTPEYQKKFGGEVPPFYVVEKRAETNQLVCGFGAETYKDHFVVSKMNFLVDREEWGKGDVQVRIRHTGALLACRIVPESQGEMLVELDEQQRGVAPGQAAVFYSNGVVLGGGVIK